MLKNIGGAIGLGLAWFLIGAFIGLIVFEGLVDPDGKIADIWPAVLGLPCFVGGVTFFALIRIFERRRKLHEVSLPNAAIWGAVSGLILAVLLMLDPAIDHANGAGSNLFVLDIQFRELWQAAATVGSIATAMMAVAGWSSIWMAKQVAAPPGTRAEGRPQWRSG